MEIWNLVFMQFDRDASGKMTPLPKPSVDTGAGLERITAILEGKNNNYDTDLFEGIIRKIEEISGKKYVGGMAVDDAPFRVIADHARAATMLIADGVIPSERGRGAVLRKIIRRALRYGRRLGVQHQPQSSFLANLTIPVLETFRSILGDAEVAKIGARFAGAYYEYLLNEEWLFARTASAGADRVGEVVSAYRRAADSTGRPGLAEIDGADVFRLYDTYGVPIEVIEEIASDEGLAIDRGGFEEELRSARERSKDSSKFKGRSLHDIVQAVTQEWTTEFVGYPEDRFVFLPDAKIMRLWRVFPDGSTTETDRVIAGEEFVFYPDRTVFYPEGGGQVADRGEARGASGRASVSEVIRQGIAILHSGRVEEGHISKGEEIALSVDEWARRKTQANHTGTHLLHAALQRVLGETAQQMGSLVAPDRLRFDYAAQRPTTPAEIREIERLVNEEILRDVEVSKKRDVPIKDAVSGGATMIFGDKYGEKVRVVEVPGFSKELCGGCHVNRTGEIGAFKVLSDKGLAAGVRRIEAVTSLNAVERLQKDEEILLQLSQIANTSLDELPAKLQATLDSLRKKEKEILALKREVALAGVEARGAAGTVTPSVSVALTGVEATSATGAVTARTGASSGQPAAATSEHSPSKKPSSLGVAVGEGLHEIGGVKVLARRVPSLPANELRNLADTFRSKLKSGVVLLGTELEGKVTLLAAVTPDLVARVSAHELAQVMAPAVGGKGGGKPDLAQAGGKDAAQIEPALALGVAKVRERLSA
jgi:alanyl-tRNA synthetase